MYTRFVYYNKVLYLINSLNHWYKHGKHIKCIYHRKLIPKVGRICKSINHFLGLEPQQRETKQGIRAIYPGVRNTFCFHHATRDQDEY